VKHQFLLLLKTNKITEVNNFPGPNKPYRKNRGIYTVGNHKKTVGFFGIIFQRPTLDKLHFCIPILFREKKSFTVYEASANLNPSRRHMKASLLR
jgi:hypothetical protein